jgi:hypothetical protein
MTFHFRALSGKVPAHLIQEHTTMPDAERQPYSFEVREHGDGTPWILLVPRNDPLKILGRGLLGFQLPKGTTSARAEEIAEYLRRIISGVSYTPME